MQSRLSRLTVAGLALALVTPFFQTPAHAAGTGVIQAFGTLSPGIPLSGCANQDVSVDATLVLAATEAGPGPYSFHFAGTSSICESVQTGQGSGTLSGDVTGTITYTRTGSVLLASGSVSIQGGSTIPVEIRCQVIVRVNTEGRIVEFVKYCWVTVNLV